MRVLQLLRDVETRWSSTFLMIDRAIVLREACESCTSSLKYYSGSFSFLI
jgi:hypothetical protein